MQAVVVGRLSAVLCPWLVNPPWACWCVTVLCIIPSSALPPLPGSSRVLPLTVPLSGFQMCPSLWVLESPLQRWCLLGAVVHGPAEIPPVRALT